MSDASTPDLLQRWHTGDESALAALVEIHLPWLRNQVERRLGPFLRGRGDAGDYLQDALLDFLRDGPRFQVRDEQQFRHLLVRVIENTLRDKNDWFRAKRRNLGQQAGLPADSVLDLQSGVAVSSTPSRAVDRDETRHWVRLALELLEPEDRKVILARDYEDRSFVAIGEELGITAAAARMRWTRAVGRLAHAMRELRSGSGGDPAPTPPPSTPDWQ
jgi:RNA polymerase sigma factor (sigma-70 family)